MSEQEDFEIWAERHIGPITRNADGTYEGDMAKAWAGWQGRGTRAKLEASGTIRFSKEQRYELCDSISETMHRMMTEGQTNDEIIQHSLSNLWEARKLIIHCHFGKWETPGMLDMAPQVEAAIQHPKRLNRPHAYLEVFDDLDDDE